MDIYKYTGPKFFDSNDPCHSFALDTLVKKKFWFSPASNQDNDDDLKFTAAPELKKTVITTTLSFLDTTIQ